MGFFLFFIVIPSEKGGSSYSTEARLERTLKLGTLLSFKATAKAEFQATKSLIEEEVGSQIDLGSRPVSGVLPKDLASGQLDGGQVGPRSSIKDFVGHLESTWGNSNNWVLELRDGRNLGNLWGFPWKVSKQKLLS